MTDALKAAREILELAGKCDVVGDSKAARNSAVARFDLAARTLAPLLARKLIALSGEVLSDEAVKEIADRRPCTIDEFITLMASLIRGGKIETTMILLTTEERAKLLSDRISLRSRVAEMEAALRPFAREAVRYPNTRREDDWRPNDGAAGEYMDYRLADLRTARKALEGK